MKLTDACSTSVILVVNLWCAESSEINVTTPPTPQGGATVVDSPNLPVGGGTAMVPIHLCPMPGFERPTPFNMHTSISKEADGSDLPLSGVFIGMLYHSSIILLFLVCNSLHLFYCRREYTALLF